MANKKTPGIPDLNFIKKKKPKSNRDITEQSILRRIKKQPQRAKRHRDPETKRETLAKRKATIKANIAADPKYYDKINEKRKNTLRQKNSGAPKLKIKTPKISAPNLKIGKASKVSRYNKMVKRVSNSKDIKKLKKTIYNRNYGIRKKYEREHPEYAKNKHIIQFPPIEDLRLITKATFGRLKKIKDPDKYIKELKKLIINTTRRKNKPKTTGDFSNREQDYMQNGVEALKEALSSWHDDILSEKLKGVFDQVTVLDINKIFGTVPSYWAISEGYYYAVADFDDFMTEIYKLIDQGGVALNPIEKNELENRLFSNDPRQHKN